MSCPHACSSARKPGDVVDAPVEEESALVLRYLPPCVCQLEDARDGRGGAFRGDDAQSVFQNLLSSWISVDMFN